MKGILILSRNPELFSISEASNYKYTEKLEEALVCMSNEEYDAVIVEQVSENDNLWESFMVKISEMTLMNKCPVYLIKSFSEEVNKSTYLSLGVSDIFLGEFRFKNCFDEVGKAK